ncbi:ferredoxin family protein [Edaphovirga cremea]|uniref:ferredoxin family protein n=1 Tax=Edaphovirga cremea TaxID=2267246 RepID=UPI000DEF56BB|nr:ferredoxin family protein [Edaphovirga cremea]
MSETVNVAAKLSANKFYVDEEEAHIVLVDSPDLTELKKLIIACPAGLYQLDDKGTVHFDHAGCLECGTCRVLCNKTILEKWQYPRGSFGVEFRHG